MIDQISQIKQQLDIADVVGSYVGLKKAGKNFKGNCPFHSENTASFMVSSELQIYKCFGCGESGDMFAFVQKFEGIDFPSALEILAERAGIKLVKTDFDPSSKLKKDIYAINELATRFYHQLLITHPAGKQGLHYFSDKRKLTKETINDFMLGFAPQIPDVLYKFLSKKGFSLDLMLDAGLVIKTSGGVMDKFIGRVLFPFIDTTGKVIGFSGRTIFDRDPKYLNTSDTAVFHKSLFLYGLDKTKGFVKKEGAVFVEGPMDVISAYQGGIKNVIASSGTSLTESQLKLIARYTSDIKFCFDSDTAGTTAMLRAIELAEKQNFDIKAVLVPDPYKDLDEIVTKDPLAAKSIVINAVPVYDFFVVSALRRHDKYSAAGKKAIIAELAQKFNKVTNKVLLDHYGHEVASELGLSLEIVIEAFTNPASVMAPGSKLDKAIPAENIEDSFVFKQKSPEYYIISLFLMSDVDKIAKYAYKLELEDFTEIACRSIFEALTKYLEANPEVKKLSLPDIKENLAPEYWSIYEDLCLWDLGYIKDQDASIIELVTRLLSLSLKRQLKELSEQLRLAEKEKDTEKVTKLTKKFTKLSKKLVTN